MTNIGPSAGVIGLSCALLLQEAGYTVTIVARDFPSPFETMDPITKINFTSPWGGARMLPPFFRVRKYLYMNPGSNLSRPGLTDVGVCLILFPIGN